MQNVKYQLDASANYLNDTESKKLNHYRDFKPRIWSSRQQLFDILKIDKEIQESSQEINYQHIKFKQGNKICLSGEECNYLYVVYSGFLKSSWSDSLGIEKVLNFPMRGDIIGLDGMLENKYKNDVVALSDTELIMIPNNMNKFKDADDLLIVKK
jgi:CRP/FNR family transcriptional regulator